MDNLFQKYQNILIAQVKNNGDLSSKNLMQLMDLHKQDVNNELQGTEEGLELLPVDDYIPKINIEKVLELKEKLQKDIEKVKSKTIEEKALLEKKRTNFDETIRLNSMLEVATENLKAVKEQSISDYITKIKTIEENGGEAAALKIGLKDINNSKEVKRAIEIVNKLTEKAEKTKANSINPIDYETTLKFLDEHEIELNEKLLNEFKSNLSNLKFNGALSVVASLNNELKNQLSGGYATENKLDEIERKEIIQAAKELITLIDENIEVHAPILKHSFGIHTDIWDQNNVPSPTKKPLKLAKLLGDDYFKPTYKNQIELQFGDKKTKYSLDEINNLDSVPNELYDSSIPYLENFKNGVTKRRPVLEEERKKWIEQIKSKVKESLSDSNKIYIVKKDLANGLLALRTLANDNKYFKLYHSN